MKFQICLLIATAIVAHLEASNILAVWPVPSRSHFSVGLALFERLAENGHKITLISPYVQQDSNENIKFVKLEKVANIVSVMSYLEIRNLSMINLLKYNVDSARDYVDFALSDENMKREIQSKESYDLFMLDVFLNDALLGIAHYLNLPVIAFSSAGASRWSDEMVKNPVNPAYNPNMFLGLTDEMNLFERMANTLMAVVDLVSYHFYYIPAQEALYKEYFFGLIKEPMPKLIDLIHAVDLVLLNSHPVTQFPRAHVPNSIEVGGVHLRTMEDQVHPEFMKLMDKNKKGIIYLSLGGNIKSSDLPIEKLEVFLKVFASMEDVLVLWKFESIALKERHGNNIIIGPWMPQQEILKHKNLKVFISHGGLLSSMEALFYGKPVIGIPFFNDQKFNMARATSQGYGITLDYDTLDFDSLKNAVDTIFTNGSYRDNAEKLSKVFSDNPIKPIDKAVYYVEHVIRNGGASHLKTTATKLSLLQIHLIDQIILAATLITAVALIAIFALSKTVKYLKLKFQKRGKSHPIKTSKGNKFKSN